LYGIFEHVTFQLAYKYEKENRVSGKDSRRIWFARQEELLSQLHLSWSERKKREHQKILEKNPFSD
jgi:hypothetical protein